MRSFYLFIPFCLLMLGCMTQVSASSSAADQAEDSFFMVSLPYQGEEVLGQSLNKAMAILLVRLTGKPNFLTTRVAQAYLDNPKAWLKTYNIVPKVEEGVQVGEWVVYTFLEDKLRQEFGQRTVSIWPLSERPETLVFGILEQGETVMFLDEKTLSYRPDVDFRGVLKQRGLSVKIPETSWFKKIPMIHDWTQNLKSGSEGGGFYLVFTLQLNALKEKRLVWALYNPSRHLVTDGLLTGEVAKELMTQMFDQIMDYYRTQPLTQSHHESHNETNREIIVVLHNVTTFEQLSEFEQFLHSRPDRVQDFVLVSMQADQVQYRIISSVAPEDMINWMASWPKAHLNQEKSSHQEIHLNGHLD